MNISVKAFLQTALHLLYSFIALYLCTYALKQILPNNPPEARTPTSQVESSSVAPEQQ